MGTFTSFIWIGFSICRGSSNETLVSTHACIDPLSLRAVHILRLQPVLDRQIKRPTHPVDTGLQIAHSDADAITPLELGMRQENLTAGIDLVQRGRIQSFQF